MITNWENRRSKFNHDWLKNEYLPALGKWRRILNDEVVDDHFESKFLLEVLPLWKKKEGEIIKIVQDFEKEMSPAILFNKKSLSQCQPDMKESLKALVDALWRIRNPVSTWLENSFFAIDSVSKSFYTLSEAFDGFNQVLRATECRIIADLFEEFRKNCIRLGDAVEKFPHEVLVT
jgi:hypothetical protein